MKSKCCGIRCRVRVRVEEMSQTVQTASTVHVSHMSSSNIQPNQLGLPGMLYMKDPRLVLALSTVYQESPSHGVEHYSSRHLGFDGQGAIDADR